MQTLVVGCSFVYNLKFHPTINTDRYAIFGSSGASNQSIAARIQHQVLTQQYQQVAVLWSGINRLSLCCPEQTSALFDYEFHDHIGTAKWYHSGGIGCSGEQPTAPALLRNHFRTQYLTAGPTYLTDLTLSSIITVQSLLKTLSIPTIMSFIYDIHSAAPSQHEVSHGQINTNSKLVDLVDWSLFPAKQTPWEWATEHQGLYEGDQYHPKTDYLCEWFRQQLDIDLEA